MPAGRVEVCGDGRSARSRPELGQCGSDRVIAPAPEANRGAGVDERRVPRAAVIGVNVAHDGRARPARALRLPHARERTRWCPLVVTRRSPVLIRPVANRLPHAFPSPGALDRRFGRRAGQAALCTGARHRTAALRTYAGAEVVVNGRDRHAQPLGDRANPMALAPQPARRLDALSGRVLKAQLACGQSGGFQRLASGAEVRRHTGAARPVRMLAHPLALGRRRGSRTFAGPVLPPRWPAHLGGPVAKRPQDRLIAPASWCARVRHRHISGWSGGRPRPARTWGQCRTGPSHR